MNDETLGDLLRITRKSIPEGGAQDWLASALGELGHDVTKHSISRIERGLAKPSVDLVIAIHRLFERELPSSDLPHLSYWLTKRLEMDVVDSSNMDSVRAALSGTSPSGSRLRDASGDFSLANFPRGFSPLRIICGDRREEHPVSRADLFAYSASITDLMFLPDIRHFPIDTRIRSDKVFLRSTEEWLREEFGRAHLLVVGSPAVNLFSRKINKGAIFRFKLGTEIRAWEEMIGRLNQLEDPDWATVFGEMALYKKDEISTNPKDYKKTLPEEHLKQIIELRNRTLDADGEEEDVRSRMNAFRKAGFVDPADGKIYGSATRMNNDFAVVSVAKNPYAEADSQFIAVLVAGIHGPGTAIALRELAGAQDPNFFVDYPLGGIMEISLNHNYEWAQIFETANATWQTRPYRPEKVRANLEALTNSRQGTGGTKWAKDLEPQEIEDCISLLDRLYPPDPEV